MAVSRLVHDSVCLFMVVDGVEAEGMQVCMCVVVPLIRPYTILSFQQCIYKCDGWTAKLNRWKLK